MNGAFSVRTDPGPALLTDGQQMAFCVQREGERGDRERERKEETHREDGGGMGFFRTLQSGALYAALKCLIK